MISLLSLLLIPLIGILIYRRMSTILSSLINLKAFLSSFIKALVFKFINLKAFISVNLNKFYKLIKKVFKLNKLSRFFKSKLYKLKKIYRFFKSKVFNLKAFISVNLNKFYKLIKKVFKLNKLSRLFQSTKYKLNKLYRFFKSKVFNLNNLSQFFKSKGFKIVLIILFILLFIIFNIYISVKTGMPIKLDEKNPEEWKKLIESIFHQKNLGYLLPHYPDGSIDLKLVDSTDIHFDRLYYGEQSAKLYLVGLENKLLRLKSMAKAIESAPSSSEARKLFDIYFHNQGVAMRYLDGLDNSIGLFHRLNPSLIKADYAIVFHSIDQSIHEALRKH